jgi:hypothetical protein
MVYFFLYSQTDFFLRGRQIEEGGKDFDKFVSDFSVDGTVASPKFQRDFFGPI